MGVDFYLNPPKDDDPIDSGGCPFTDECCEDCQEDGENFTEPGAEPREKCCSH
jgi:hypothetical protein